MPSGSWRLRICSLYVSSPISQPFRAAVSSGLIPTTITLIYSLASSFRIAAIKWASYRPICQYYIAGNFRVCVSRRSLTLMARFRTSLASYVSQKAFSMPSYFSLLTTSFPRSLKSGLISMRIHCLVSVILLSLVALDVSAITDPIGAGVARCSSTCWGFLLESPRLG